MGSNKRALRDQLVLMPCRALEAFGPSRMRASRPGSPCRLNALSGIGGVRTIILGWVGVVLWTISS